MKYCSPTEAQEFRRNKHNNNIKHHGLVLVVLFIPNQNTNRNQHQNISIIRGLAEWPSGVTHHRHPSIHMDDIPPFHSHSFSTRDRDFIPPFRWTTISTLFSSIHDHLSDQVGTYRYIRNSQRIVVSKEKNKNTSPHLSPSSYSYDPASHQYYSTWLQASTIIKSFLDPPILHSWSLFFFRLYRPTRDGNLLKGKNTCCWHIGSEFLIDLNGLNQFRSVHRVDEDADHSPAHHQWLHPRRIPG